MWAEHASTLTSPRMKPLAAVPTVNAPRWRPYATMLTGPLLVVVAVAALAMLTVQVLGALRAREASNHQFTQSRQIATQALLRLAYSRQSEDWQTYRAAMSRIEAARQARTILVQSHPPDFDQIRRLLIQAGRHPDDVSTMLRMDRWLGMSWTPSSVQHDWARTDTLVNQIEAAAHIVDEVVNQDGDPARLPDMAARIRQVDTALMVTENHLTQAWGQAVRTATWVLMIGIVVISALLTLVAVLQIRRLLVRQSQHHAALREVHRRWELASVAAGLGFYHLKKDATTVELDGMAAAMHGLGNQPVTVARSQVRALIAPGDAERTLQQVDQAMLLGQDYRATYRICSADGTPRTLEAVGRLVQAHGEAPAIVGVLRDVTEEVAQAEMTLRREAAERVAQAQREFLSRLSHELRTPLNAILGFAQLLGLSQSPPLGDAQRQQVHWILAAGQQLLALVEDVLDLSKVEAGEITLNLEPVDVNALVRDCLPLLDAARQQHQVTILNRATDRPLYARVDVQRLRQIVLNLLSNACKYNRLHGHVTIDTQHEGSDIVIDIGDDGIGMSANDAAQLFQPFKRLPSAVSHAEGTGLGLYIVKQLVERMQGSVSVMSEPGVGTRFTVRLPRHTEAAQAHAAQVAQSSSS